MASKIINKLYTTTDKNGTKYEITYFVHAASITPFRVDYYSDTADAWTGGTNTYYLDATFTRAGDHYYVHYVAYSPAFEKLNRVFSERNKNGTKYEIIYFVALADIGTYNADYGDSADAWTSGTGTYQAFNTQTKTGENFYVHYVAYSAGYEDASGSFGSTSRTFRTYDNAEVLMNPAWWGIKEATATDVAKSVHKINLTGNGDTFSGVAAEGDIVYINAIKDDVVVPKYQGTADFSLCPYKDEGGNTLTVTDLPISNMNKKMPTLIYQIKFLTSVSVNTYAIWNGVNPSGTAGFGSSSKAPYLTTAHTWKSISQHVEEDGQKIGSVDYNMIIRRMKRAPSAGVQLTWDLAPAGGEWTWSS